MNETKIQWAHYTGGPWHLCSKVSDGCKNCYAWLLMITRLWPIIRNAWKTAGVEDWKTREVWGDNAPRVLTKGFWDSVLALDRKAAREGVRYKVFPSMIDPFDEMPAGIIDQDGHWLDKNQVLADFLDVIRRCSNLDFLLLTKRPENFAIMTGGAMRHLTPDGTAIGFESETWKMLHAWKHGSAPANIWIGCTVENQEYADKRIPELLKIPAVCRFVSYEPALGPVDFSKWLYETHENVGTERLSSSEIWTTGNSPGRDDMAEQSRDADSCGEQNGLRISPGQDNARKNSPSRPSAQAGLPSFQGSNTRWNDNKSRGREQIQQPPDQSDGGDLQRAAGPRDTKTQTRARMSAARGSEQYGEADSSAGLGNSSATNGGGTFEADCGRLQHDRQERLKDRVRSPLGIHQIIVGGESGPKARPFNIEWARSTIEQCKAAGIACFVKQMGSVVQDRNDAGYDGESPKEWPTGTDFDDEYFDPGVYQGKPVRVLLKDKKGGDITEWPEDLRIRQFPNTNAR